MLLIDRVEQLKSVILLNKSYEEFIDYLNDINAPTDNFELFVTIIVNLYVDNDFYAILALIDSNMEKFIEYETSNLVFREIIKELMDDYIESKITQ